MELGKSSIPQKKFEEIKENHPDVPQSGPGAGTAYMNFTFGKFNKKNPNGWTGEKWSSIINDPDQTKFFEAVGYKGVDGQSGGKYIGRSLIGITHGENYKQIGRFLGLDLVNNPELINKDAETRSSLSSFLPLNPTPLAT
jgi:hypothetical protein